MSDTGLHADTDQPVGPLGRALRDYAVFTLDPDGLVTSWNLGAELIIGATASEVIGRSAAVFHTAEQRAEGHPEWVLEQARKLGSHVDEGWRVRKDGSLFWAHVVTTALWSSKGELRGYAKVARDDTVVHNKLEQSSRRLEQSSRLFRDLFSLTPVALGLFDRHGTVLDCNMAMCELFGHLPERLRGSHATALIPQDAPAREQLVEAFARGVPPDGESVQECRLVRSDGEPVFCELHIARAEEDSGEPFWVVVFEDVTDRYREAESLRYWAYHDELTGLWNRAAIPDLLADAHPDRAAVLYCDIRNFSRVNESLGYPAGDEVLVALARRLEEHLPEGWPVARAAGDEFAVICPDVEEAGGIAAVATTVSRVMHAAIEVRGERIQVSSMIGAAVASESGGRGEDLVRLAMSALVRAKKTGRVGISMAEPALIDSLEGRLRLEAELRRALDRDELTLHYQPQVGADGTIRSAEALIRWPHPQRGLLHPDVFLPIADQNGMMPDIDRWVVRRALRDAARWPAPRDGEPVAVSLNIGELMPGYPIFTDLLERAVTETGIDWSRIIVELVETAIVDLPSRVRAGMAELTGRGVRFAVDDFGTGYSSLSRVRDFPAQIIKVDRTFVSEITTSPYDFVVVKAVTDLAGALGCSCVAEGVETVGQFDRLRSIPIERYQGWLFSKAVPSAELADLIEAGPIRPALAVAE
ncbi:PAS domain S-box-containing protein/diguanylate cyclase (GGDEF)-like protein [Saccharopolyspora erythraea NRRL 2338]|uniref:Diguanylate cyclase/phosphodiesterase with PAS/PAC sensor(S) n=2 Tax=Saccharopolyspora erythraea TaxID=1836 RepID=A4F5X6_SACEN|nr:bifunctional diguanylate cyclase/phosphodiesterase [Saccharopolyspora erythraea]EQD83988.1 diguanylate phosphodiesterase [Saccharopolyspora erythraea D]PFG93249.1 PAS domain S-box-containing protein/diguanylate cyclase (GGDEF)-like protein [Saccharopolyspora erythraea NRRL 2338]QRK90101.1 EAL domain-containing protein [Saccharopolyspora erythraea]CAL99450.1 diguanylate cyclase/phosphodiesterase with PAS/PAC sensor(s) [Saccharopolyspora erythraea NRRL 2338]